MRRDPLVAAGLWLGAGHNQLEEKRRYLEGDQAIPLGEHQPHSQEGDALSSIPLPVAPSTPGAVHYKGEHIPAANGDLLMAAVSNPSRWVQQVTGPLWRHSPPGGATIHSM